MVPSMFSAPATRDQLQDFAVLSPATIKAVVQDPAIAPAIAPAILPLEDLDAKPAKPSAPVAQAGGLRVDVKVAAGTSESGSGSVAPPTPEPSASEEEAGRPRKQARKLPPGTQGELSTSA